MSKTVSNIETQRYEQHVQMLVDLLRFYRRLDQAEAARALGRLIVGLFMEIQKNHPDLWTKEKARW